jgi:hypothetical protein
MIRMIREMYDDVYYHLYQISGNLEYIIKEARLKTSKKPLNYKFFV